MEKSLRYTFLPELGTPRKGKVRDIYEHEGSLALIASDRISVFDVVLPEPIPDKGRILTGLSRYWFEQTSDIIDNHIMGYPDPNVMIVKKCKPILIEVIVRAYLVGSLWRDYEAGSRIKCGIPLPNGLKQNDPLPELIVTPTTKSHEGHDEDITKEEIIRRDIVDADLWNEIESTALRLFRRGQDVLSKKGLILIDTKYEFGLDPQGHLILIDEIHTPDSSRFWYKSDMEVKEVKFPDKEYLRGWLRNEGFTGAGTPPPIPDHVREKVRHGYRDVYETITGRKLAEENESVARRVLSHLKSARLIKGVYALLLLGSEKDMPHADKITSILTDHGIPHQTIVASAHKQPQKVMDLIDQYNLSLEPLVCIGIAGRSNALTGVLAANLKWPVIACPPFKDYSDYLTNIHSSLQMPSMVPAMTVVEPSNAALAAVKILKTMEML